MRELILLAFIVLFGYLTIAYRASFDLFLLITAVLSAGYLAGLESK